MGYFPKAATPEEADKLISLLPAIQHAAAANQALHASATAFVRTIAARLLTFDDRSLLEVLDYSSLADFYNIGLLGSEGDPRKLQVRFNIYPDFPGDVEYHTHRTRVSSLIVSGGVTNNMFGIEALHREENGTHRVVSAQRTPGKSILHETGIVGFLPQAEIRSHRPGQAYAIPVDTFHSITTLTDTVTLCAFHRDSTGYRESLVCKMRTAGLVEPASRPLDEEVLRLVRGSLRAASS